MRKILFRGKEFSGDWVYGSFLEGCMDDAALIVKINKRKMLKHTIAVIPKTVGQYTGLTDKNGTKIFEGDIVYIGEKKHGCDAIELVFYDGGGFSPFAIPDWECTPDADDVEIIGNIHDNPELLGGDTNV